VRAATSAVAGVLRAGVRAVRALARMAPAEEPEALPAAPRPGDQPVAEVEDRWAASWRSSALAALAVLGLLLLIGWHVGERLMHYGWTGIGAVYTIVVTSYVFSRFVFAAVYRPPRNAGIEPHIAIVVPAFNEGEAVARTIDSCMALDYPRDRLEVVVINDGSSDDTWDVMLRAAARYPAGAVRCIDLGSNQGKRAAMAAGMRETTAEIVVFVDSDSMPARGAVRILVQAFAEEKCAAVSGLTYVRNAETNLLTRMQAVRYFISFQLLKSAESVLGAVTCCSGCFAAYRRTAVMEVLDKWEHQRFLGTECTYGDDRALTNMMLRRGWVARYDRRAEAWTDAPDRYGKFFRQQLRWKKSWAREGPILLTHLWRTRPLAFPFALIATLSGLLSPIVLALNVLWAPIAESLIPAFYLLALYLMAMCYALTHRALRSDGLWRYSIVATFFYVAFSPQLYWAIARIRDGSWGTRAPAGADGPVADDAAGFAVLAGPVGQGGR
jgi:hyaluronan synthase